MSEESKTITLVIDQAEMAVRIIEAIADEPRPPGVDAGELLDRMDDKARESALRAATSVAQYIVGVITKEIPEASMYHGVRRPN